MKLTQMPLKEIIVYQFGESTLENITKERAIVEKPVFWCNGYLFYIYEDDTEITSEKKLDGTWVLDSFVYAKCKEKINQVKWNGYSVEVIDCSGITWYEELTKSLLEVEK